MAEQKTRYYVVVQKNAEDSSEGEPVALIDAGNASQAARHFVEKNFAVRFAEQPDVFAAACKGIKPEKAEASATSS